MVGRAVAPVTPSRMLPYPSTLTPIPESRVADSLASTSDAELRAHLERILDGQYDLEHELGRGGMGIVFKARDRRLKRAVAVKLLPPELGYRGEIRTRFLREAETAAQLTHPNIVPIYTVDEKQGLVYFVMAFVDGDNLARRIHERGAMDPQEARRVLRSVAEAMAYAHERHVIHRDIKPDNILLDAATGRAIVTDFGIARAISEGADARLTATGIAIGTPAYMSPEQSAGDKEIDGRSDLYSLGVVAYQMLAGELPFNASNTPAMLVKHLSERPTPLELRRPDIPHDLAATVMCLLEKDPADRFPDANALVAALDGAGPIPAPRASSPRATPVWSPLPTAEAGVPAEDWMRWNAPVVDAFRRRLPRFIIVNAVIIGLAVVTGNNFTFITAFWSVILAFKYAKLWSEGYDWRDVFRQPRDRLFFDVLSETLDDFRALFDREKRAEVRARWRASRGKPGLMTPPVPGALARPSGLTAAELSVIGGTRAEVVRRAAMDRDEVAQLVASMPDREKKQLKDVTETARSLAEKVRAIAVALAELDRTTVSGGAGSLDREIARLEAQANPLDRDASEARVRRLATLKRDRRGASERQRRRDELQAKQESCTIALQNLRFDVLRLKTGASSTANVTLLAERAMTLSRDVEDLIGPGASAPPERR